MSGWSPPTVPREWVVVAVALLGVSFVYSLLVVQAPFLILGPVVLAGTLYLAWRFVRAVESIADALQQIASQRERE